MTKTRNKCESSRWWLRWGGCSCHNSKNARRKTRKTDKAREKRAWKKQEENDG